MAAATKTKKSFTAAAKSPTAPNEPTTIAAVLAVEDAQAPHQNAGPHGQRTAAVRAARKPRGWGATTVRMGSGGGVPKVIILGRGQLTGRKLFATRLPEEVMERLRGLVSGPDYLALQLAVTAYCEALESRQDTQVIPAENLG